MTELKASDFDWVCEQRPAMYGKHEWTLPAGDYYFGDPCYILTDAAYKECLDMNGMDGCHMDKCGRMYVTYNTLWGDGSYYGLHGEYGVDSGCLALIPMSMANPDVVHNRLVSKHMGFSEPVTFTADKGVFRITYKGEDVEVVDTN